MHALRKLLLVGAALTALVGATAEGCPKGRQPQPPTGGHRAPKPATPKPGGPEQGKPFPGNVRLTFWVTADHPVDVVYSIGTRHASHSCDRSCHWDDTAKPTQKVIITVGPRDKRTESGRAVQVVQGNGRIVCQGDNYDSDPIDPATCEGEVVI